MPTTPTYTAFADGRRVAAGPFNAVVRELKSPAGPDDLTEVRVFDDQTGVQLHIDLRAPEDALLRQIAAVWPEGSAVEAGATAKRGRGRPKLGVVSKEVTLLPRHWAWLSTQRGGASATLRRLVDEARKRNVSTDRVRKAQDATYRFMNATVGDHPGYQEAMRALYARQAEAFAEHAVSWPTDVRDHAARLAGPVWESEDDDG